MRHFLLVAIACWSVNVSAAEPATSEVLARLDTAYAERGSTEGDKALDEAIGAALKDHPDDYGVLWRAARAKWWFADGASDARMKKQLGKEGWNLGERAVTANPKGAAGHYFTALGIGAYSQAVGIMKALGEGLEGKFNQRLDKAIELEPGLDRSGGLVTKGRYYYELPWPKRDLDKSVELLTKALAKNPENIRANLFLAETLLKDGEAKKAQVAIEKVAAADIAFDPPEGRRVKQMAKQVRERIGEELK